MTTPLRMAVIGLGYFGTFHARHCATHPDSQLVAVIDPDSARATPVAQEHGCKRVDAIADLAGQVDAVCIAAPTLFHADLAVQCFEHGLDVLVEKPIAATSGAAQRMIDAAAKHDRILQVGHIERFSPTYSALKERVSAAEMVDARRISPFRDRANDVDVVADLMIHDIDLVLDLLDGRVVDVRSDGQWLANETPDHVTARLVFDDGAVAYLTASRIGFDTERTVRVFEAEATHLCDLGQGHLSTMRKRGMAQDLGEDAVGVSHDRIEPADNLRAELEAFFACCRTRSAPLISGAQGRDALEIAEKIADSLNAGRSLGWRAQSGGDIADLRQTGEYRL